MDNPIRDMVDNILSNKEADALKNFEAAFASKLSDSLETRKQEVAAELGEQHMVADKIMKAAEFVGKVFTGEFARDATEPKEQPKQDANKPEPKKDNKK
jgi:hypothetical protein